MLHEDDCAGVDRWHIFCNPSIIILACFRARGFKLQPSFLIFLADTMGRVSYFSDTWTVKYPFIKEGSTKYSAYCKKCNCEVSISNGGVTSIEKHVKTDKHKNNSLASVASLKLTEHFRRKLLGRPEKALAAAEGLFAFHTVKHNQSFK